MIDSLDDIKRKALLVPCSTKEMLQNWVRIFLGIDLPDCTVDPSSNSNPMEMLWLAYTKMMEGDVDYARMLFFAARDCFKSLLASVIELLSVLHLKRDGCHLAAIESQSHVCARYLRKYAVLPYIRDYVSQMSVRRIEFTRYEREGETISFVEHNALAPEKRLSYTQVTNFIQVIIATMQGTNCIDGDTSVCMSGGTLKFAKDVLSGDRVRGFDLAGRRSIDSVVSEVSFTQKPSMRVVFDDGSQLVCSEDHPILSRYGWLRARALHMGDLVLAGATTKEAPLPSRPVPLAPVIRNPKSVILGTLLGDASLSWPRNKKKERYGCGPRFSVGHSEAQLPLLEAKKRALDMLGFSYTTNRANACQTVSCGKTIRRSAFISIQTLVNKDWVGLYELLYSAGKKRITPEALALVDQEALAYWVMDDGAPSSVAVGRLKERAFCLSTCGFSLEENNLIAGWFKDRWGLDAHVGSISNQSGKRYFVIRLTLESSRRLAGLLDEYFLPELKYKLTIPTGFLDTRCIECGSHLLPRGVESAYNRHGFARCSKCPHPNLRAERERQRAFVACFSRKVVSLEFLGVRTVYDLEIATEDEQRKNFWVNAGKSLILLHNSAHSQLLLLDELDLAPPAPVEESKMIPTQCADGKPPAILMTSSRKFAAGLVQDEIDEAEERGTKVFHWNLIDCTRPCTPDRYLADSPMIDIYISEHNLKAIPQEAFDELRDEQKEKYTKKTGHAGCLKNCRLFAVCQGRLISKQKSTSALLKTIPHVQNLFRSVDLEIAKAQLMCWKPSNYGLIYPNFDPETHILTAAQMAHKVTGEKYPESFGKGELIRLFQSRDAVPYAGMDHGYSHNFAVVTGFKDGARFFVVDVISAPELELAQKIEICGARIKDINPTIFADPEDPASNKTLKKYFKMRDWSKKPGSVVGGISIVRYKLMPTMGNEPQLYFLGGDDGIEMLTKDFMKYRWQLDKNSGKPTDVPSEDDDDRMDGLRYCIMNVFEKTGRVLAAPETQPKPGVPISSISNSGAQGVYTQNDWARQVLEEYLGAPPSDLGEKQENLEPTKGKKGSFLWSIE